MGFVAEFRRYFKFFDVLNALNEYYENEKGGILILELLNLL